jgi:hypothetical protein
LLDEIPKPRLLNLSQVFLQILQGSRPFALVIGALIARCVDDCPERVGVLSKLHLVLIELGKLLAPTLKLFVCLPSQVKLPHSFEVVIKIVPAMLRAESLFRKFTQVLDLVRPFFL